MNRLEKALFELRMDLARNPGGMDGAKLDALLADVARESDDNLRATAEFFDLDLESIEERSAAMQFDGGLTRVTANRLALTRELQSAMPTMSAAMCRWFSQNAATVMEYGRERGLSRDELAAELRTYFRREGGLPPRGGDSMDSGYRRDGRGGQNAPAGLKTA